jgi:hypothetical protein
MTNDEIQELAYQAEESITDGGTNYHWEFCVAFAKLVAAAEREACAKVVEEPWQGSPKEIAAAIRARGEG